METDKFEKHIKAKLQEREIHPSENAWSKISSELNDDTAKKKPMYLWMGVAASVVVVIGIALFYFNGTKETGNLPILVDVDSTPVEKEEIEFVVTDHNETGAFLEEVKIFNEKSKVEDGAIVAKVPKAIIKKTTIPKQSQEPNSKDTKEEEMSLIAVVDEKIINAKVEEVLARVNTMELKNSVTDAEVDSLLKLAQQDILKGKIFRTDATVDAMALLTEVEDELDQSFRDQIFNSLKAGFIKVRTAVADRNN